jgi:hypothetical protein
MSCRPWEESAQDPETPNPVTPTKPPRNAMAGENNSDTENSECQSDSDEPFRKKMRIRVDKQKREWHLIVYVPITRWPIGERAEMDEDAMTFDDAEEARKEMLIAGLKKAIYPKPTDLGFWKKGQEHVSRRAHFTTYKCLMQHCAKCKCMLRLVMAGDYVELQRSENRHQADSHAEDGFKRLKYDQMVAIREAVITAPQRSATILRKYMKLHDSPTKTNSARAYA